jgi:hypothetical protein
MQSTTNTEGQLPGFAVVGHAIVSADGMIADADGRMPERLRNEADFALFQAALDRASVVVVGRHGHQRHPNPGRRRLVFTASVEAFEPDRRDPLASLFNPAGIELRAALTRMGVPPGTVAVTGGKRVFDWFLPHYHEFMLAEVHALVLPGGISCFSEGHARTVLARAELAPASVKTIDAQNGVTLTRWTRR